MDQHIVWSFSALCADIDVARILREAPECRALEIVVTEEQRVLAVRRVVYDRAESCALHLKSGAHGWTSWIPRVTPSRVLEGGTTVTEAWMLAWTRPSCHLVEWAELLAQLDAVDARYAERVRVTVRAA